MVQTLSANAAIDPNDATAAPFQRAGFTSGSVTFQTPFYILQDVVPETNNAGGYAQPSGGAASGLVIPSAIGLTVNAGASLQAAQIWVGVGTDENAAAGGNLILDAATVGVGAFYGANNVSGGSLTIANSGAAESALAKLGQLTMTNGATLNVFRGRRSGFQSFVGHQGSIRLKISDSAINVGSAEYLGSDIDGSDAFYGTNDHIMYLGIYSEYSNVLLKGATKYELTHPLVQFDNVRIVFPTGVSGATGGDGALYMGAGRGDISSFSQPPVCYIRERLMTNLIPLLTSGYHLHLVK